MQNLQNLLSQLESKIFLHEKTNPLVSNSTIGWQIEHSLKTIYLVVESVKNSNPKEYKWKFNRTKLIISILGKIPRGKVRAPKLVVPDENITEESLKRSFEKVKKVLQEWESFDKSAFFLHPFFGKLNKKPTEWFLKLHTNHHLKIVNDICNKKLRN